MKIIREYETPEEILARVKDPVLAMLEYARDQRDEIRLAYSFYDDTLRAYANGSASIAEVQGAYLEFLSLIE